MVLLRQIEVLMSQGKAPPIACREAGISQQSYYRWRKEYGGLELDQAKRMKELQRENVRLKRLVADLALEKQVLKDVASRFCRCPSVGIGMTNSYVGRSRKRQSMLRAASRRSLAHRRFQRISMSKPSAVNSVCPMN